MGILHVQNALPPSLVVSRSTLPSATFCCNLAAVFVRPTECTRINQGSPDALAIGDAWPDLLGWETHDNILLLLLNLTQPPVLCTEANGIRWVVVVVVVVTVPELRVGVRM